jgi:hypothetical protein
MATVEVTTVRSPTQPVDDLDTGLPCACASEKPPKSARDPIGQVPIRLRLGG